MKSAQDFRNEVLGKGFDIDGYYGNQCWDGYAYYMKWLGYGFANCTSSGYVKDIWNNRHTNGALNNCIEVTVMQQGDIAIFGETAETPSSHIAIYMRDNGNGTGVFLGQNQGGANGAFNEVTLSYSGTLGALRPKCYVEQPAPEPKPEPTPHKIGYKVHMADIGYGPMVYDGDMAGTTGQNRRIEAIMFDLLGQKIKVKVHLENIGWVDYGWITDKTEIGTTGESRRLEALCLEGNIEYRVHIADEGWSAWTHADGIATLGTVGMSHAIEAIEIRVS